MSEDNIIPIIVFVVIALAVLTPATTQVVVVASDSGNGFVAFLGLLVLLLVVLVLSALLLAMWPVWQVLVVMGGTALLTLMCGRVSVSMKSAALTRPHTVFKYIEIHGVNWSVKKRKLRADIDTKWLSYTGAGLAVVALIASVAMIHSTSFGEFYYKEHHRLIVEDYPRIVRSILGWFFDLAGEHNDKFKNVAYFVVFLSCVVLCSRAPRHAKAVASDTFSTASEMIAAGDVIPGLRDTGELHRLSNRISDLFTQRLSLPAPPSRADDFFRRLAATDGSECQDLMAEAIAEANGFLECGTLAASYAEAVMQHYLEVTSQVMKPGLNSFHIQLDLEIKAGFAAEELWKAFYDGKWEEVTDALQHLDGRISAIHEMVFRREQGLTT